MEHLFEPHLWITGASADLPQRHNHRPRTPVPAPEGSRGRESLMPDDVTATLHRAITAAEQPRRCRCARCNWTFTVEVPDGVDPGVYARARWFCPHCGQESADELAYRRASEPSR